MHFQMKIPESYEKSESSCDWFQCTSRPRDFMTNFLSFQNALNAQRVAGLIKTAETMGILDTSSESSKQSDIDEILGFLAALEKVSILSDWPSVKCFLNRTVA